jgi:glycosyltransferase involved in cell wall biosynthesis
MRIGFDGKRTTQNFTGLGNYSRYIIRLLIKFNRQDQYILYALKSPSSEVELRGAEYQYPAKGSLNSYWRSFGIINNLVKDRIELFHGLTNEIPYGLKKAGIHSIVTIHDLIFIRYPQYYPFIDRLIYELKFRYAALNADKVIAISEQTKQDLIRYFGVQKDRIEVIYQNCDPIFHQMASPEVNKLVVMKYSLPASYLLSVGTIEERKNLMLIVRSLTKITDVHLVVVGKETKYAKVVKDFIAKNDLVDRVHFLKNVSHTDLPSIYQQAELFIYPSRFEGFGIPIVEALHSGIPVIAAKGSCLEEAGGPGSVYVDPDDETALATHIKKILLNVELKSQMVSSGRQYLETFNDQKIAGQINQLYTNIIEHAER